MMSAAQGWTKSANGPAGRWLSPVPFKQYRDTKLALAALALAAFPALALATTGSLGAIAAILLSGVLPAAIALDLRRDGDFDRTLMLGLLATGAALAGGVLKGLPAPLAFVLLAVQTLEAVALGSRAMRTRALAMLAITCSTIAVFTASTGHPLIFTPSGGPAAAMALMVGANVLMLVLGLARAAGIERRDSGDRLARTIELEAAASEVVIAADRSGAVLRVSGNAIRVLGIPADALAGRGLAELVLVADRPALLTALSDCAHDAAERGYERTIRIRMRVSAEQNRPCYRWIEVRLARSPAADCVALASLRDITATIADEEASAAMAVEAEVAQRTRATFLTTVNHELRTPLNAIIGFSDILASPATMPRQEEKLREYASLINGAGQDLLRMVTAMIDITRIDSGIYDFQPERAVLRPVIEAAVESFRQEPEAEGAPIGLRFAESGLDAEIDERALRQILHELLSNAVKFGGPGRAIEASVFGDAEWACISVSDRGRGLAPEKLTLLGRHFARLDDGLTRATGGVGLGLSLATGLARLHGGRLAIESREGVGTTVTLSLPRIGAPASTSPVNLRALTLDQVRQPCLPQPAAPLGTTEIEWERLRA